MQFWRHLQLRGKALPCSRNELCDKLVVTCPVKADRCQVTEGLGAVTRTGLVQPQSQFLLSEGVRPSGGKRQCRLLKRTGWWDLLLGGLLTTHGNG